MPRSDADVPRREKGLTRHDSEALSPATRPEQRRGYLGHVGRGFLNSVETLTDPFNTIAKKRRKREEERLQSLERDMRALEKGQPF